MDFEKALDSLDRETFGSLWGITRFLRNLSPWFTTPMRAWHAKSCMLAWSPLALSFLLEPGRDLFYHRFCFFWLLTGLYERLQRTRERNPVDCWYNCTTSAMLMTSPSFSIRKTPELDNNSWTLHSWGWTSTDAILRSCVCVKIRIRKARTTLPWEIFGAQGTSPHKPKRGSLIPTLSLFYFIVHTDTL